MKFLMLHHVDQRTIEKMYKSYTPVFILSTGRSGSKFLTFLLKHSPNIVSYHEPQPTLQYFSNFAFQNQHKEDILKKMIDASRMELILDVYIKNKIYVESNQCLTFFSPAIKEIFKQSKFIHIVRHPGDFVRSAIRKGWHRNDSIWESGRVKIKDRFKWERMNQIERLAWVWCVTTDFIENFKKKIEPERVKTFRIEDLFSKISSVNSMLRFINAKEISPDKIKNIQNTKINEPTILPNETPNMKKTAYFPDYNDWRQDMKIQLKMYTGKYERTFGYKL